MTTLLLILLVTGVGLTMLLLLGSIFIQGYIYTEPNRAIFWGAPAAGAVLTLFLASWCAANAYSDKASPKDIPYDTLFNFSPRVDLSEQPAKRLWAIRKGGKTTEYVSQRTAQTRWEYRDTTYDRRPWNPANVEAIEIEYDGQKIRLDRQPYTEGAYRTFVSPDGWTMTEFDDGPTGVPTAFRVGRFLANLFFNGMHFLLWFLCLWLLLRYLWSHALGFAFVLWLVMTLTVMPMLLGYAAQVAVQRQHQPVPAAAWVLSRPLDL